jgi:hypothetical protein
MQQAKPAMDGSRLYRTSRRSTRPLYRSFSARWLAKKRELLHPDLPLINRSSLLRPDG